MATLVAQTRNVFEDYRAVATSMDALSDADKRMVQKHFDDLHEKFWADHGEKLFQESMKMRLRRDDRLHVNSLTINLSKRLDIRAVTGLQEWLDAVFDFVDQYSEGLNELAPVPMKGCCINEMITDIFFAINVGLEEQHTVHGCQRRYQM